MYKDPSCRTAALQHETSNEVRTTAVTGRRADMSALASTSSACYTCVLSRTICNSSARFSRFSTSTRRKREATFWTGKKWPHHDETQSGDLLRELERMQSEDGVKIDESVFATRPGGKKM